MLRGVLSAHPDVVAFPSETDFIWRYGNEHSPVDEMEPERIDPNVIAHIRRQFDILSARHNGARVLDKTCANALRLDFVHTVFPEGYIIHLVRDGRAAAESAQRRWNARPELRYYLQKVRGISLADALRYAPSYVQYRQRLRRWSKGKRSTWGPRFAGLDELIAEKSLIEVCGLQWRACVQAADTAMEHLPPDQVITVRYEDLVSGPLPVLQRLFNHTQLTFERECRDYALRVIRPGDVDKWRGRLSDEDLERLLPHIEEELLKHGYEL
jgi:hypothetical protein